MYVHIIMSNRYIYAYVIHILYVYRAACDASGPLNPLAETRRQPLPQGGRGGNIRGGLYSTPGSEQPSVLTKVPPYTPAGGGREESPRAPGGGPSPGSRGGVPTGGPCADSKDPPTAVGFRRQRQCGRRYLWSVCVLR